MIARKKKKCKGENCDRVDYIIGRGLCYLCYGKHTLKKQSEKKEKGGKDLQQRHGKEPQSDRTEIDIFNEIWEQRPHKSEIDGAPLLPKGHKFWHWQFSHCLPKGLYPKLKLDNDNVVLMTWEQHQLWEFYPHKLQDKEEWKWLFEKRERLKQKYHGGEV